MNDFLPINKKEMLERGWQDVDFVFVTGDSYVDHPSFGVAILTRLLENEGYRVAVLSQPNWKNDGDFTQFGRPRLGFLVTSGNIDSMVAHYTAAKRLRHDDAYTAGGVAGKRPDRAVIVYSNIIKRIYPDIPVIIGGLEASLRRFAHYDYWDDAIRPSILIDSKADLLTFGMGEKQTVEIVKVLYRGAQTLILDEPTVGLDPKQIIEIRELIRQLAKKHTVILSSHILAEVREVCDYILIISKGKLVASDTPENLERNLGDSDLIEIETKASPDEVRRILETVDGIRSISTKYLENGITWAQIQEKKNTDIREKVFQAFAQNHQPLLKLNPLQVSLEDVFMELTQSDRAAEEYAEKAKKKETEDMKDDGDL